MPVVGEPRVFHKKFKFLVEIDDLGSAAFQDCSELSAEIAKIEQWEGGSIIPASKDPGRVTFTDITLTRGATQDRDLYDWFVEVANAAANSGVPEPEFRRLVDIVQLERDNSEKRRWRLFNAWPQKHTAADSWDNTADENVMEQVVLTFDFYDLIQAA